MHFSKKENIPTIEAPSIFTFSTGSHLATVRKRARAKRKELLKEVDKVGINKYLLDNSILPSLLTDGTIKKDGFGWYCLSTNKKKEPPLDTFVETIECKQHKQE